MTRSRINFIGIVELSQINLSQDPVALRDRARLMYENGVSGILVSVIASSFLVFVFGEAAYQSKFNWWLVMTTVLSLRFIDLLWWKSKVRQSDFDGALWLRRFTLGVNLTALLWSSYAVLVIFNSDLLEMTAMIIAIASMAGGSATVLAAEKKTAMFYALILLLPASIFLLFVKDSAHLPLGILGICFSFVMMIVSKRSADFTSEAIRLKNENAALVNHMEQKVEERTQEVYELSNIDPLTKLFNRAAFLKHFELSIALCRENNTGLALLFIDLDGFKKINDSFGHEAGDHILRESANRLSQVVEDAHSLCRWGGDEFLIVLEETSESGLKAKGREIIAALSKEHDWEGTSLSVGATIGVACFPDNATEESLLVQYADTAMYHQKKIAPSNVCMFDAEMAEKHAFELKLKSGLSEAINKEELRLVYQPIVSSDDAAPVAMEALLRWSFGSQNIRPDQFIPIAEQYGLINDIGAWVLNSACHEAVTWPGKLSVPVCVNVSIIQLQDEEFVEILKQSLDASGLPPQMLHIEITESVFATDTKVVSDKIRAIQALGVKVSIDDFGTGYSSLSVMQDLAVNTVKIDRAFINKIDGSGFAIVTAVIHAAKLLKFEVVAEGVETQEQKIKLAQIGIPKLQGFFFSKPIEREHLHKYFSEY